MFLVLDSGQEVATGLWDLNGRVEVFFYIGAYIEIVDR